jgi:hypothetical protein
MTNNSPHVTYEALSGRIKPTSKVEKAQLPPRRQDTKAHKELIFNEIHLAQLRVFVPWWQISFF